MEECAQTRQNTFLACCHVNPLRRLITVKAIFSRDINCRCFRITKLTNGLRQIVFIQRPYQYDTIRSGRFVKGLAMLF